jgi:hypothetical protein
MDELSLRSSDAEREEALNALREHLLSGRLTLEEFTERVGAAYGARTGGELARISEDLPDAVPAATGAPRRPSRFTPAVFAHVIRRGRLRLPRRSVGRDAPSANAPSIRVRVIGLCATVDVWRVPPKVQGAYREIIEHVRAETRRLPPAAG